MKVGVLQFVSWPQRRVELKTVYDRALQRIEIMDQTGYEAVWLAEHHFNTFSVCPSVHMIGMAVAERTERLRIGTAVSLAAYYHPLRLAEEVALLDQLSGGRVNWGAGRGFDKTEFRAFDITPDNSREKFQENVEIVLQAWGQDRVSYAGQYHQFEDIEVLPKPAQDPIPHWVAASSFEAIDWAGENGHSILMSPHDSHQDTAAKQTAYKEQLEKYGHSIEGRELPVARLMVVADSEAKAEEVAREGARWTVGAYANRPRSATKTLAGGSTPVVEGDPVERYMQDVIIFGTPESVLDKIQALRSTMNLESLMVSPLSHETFEKFTDKVLPRLI